MESRKKIIQIFVYNASNKEDQTNQICRKVFLLNLEPARKNSIFVRPFKFKRLLNGLMYARGN
ncbi:hypothetical protein BpHYR1_046896 [Brachionus plicatilis]|uniref:Uncharacterized protein n=1 Tax=Brachionus plicatilis TaxID=10195 RepID=A0A3M7P3M6_BRAPC|nr:hypothetical protein BpHYR1_046896 [Brachionus plicatilis]